MVVEEGEGVKCPHCGKVHKEYVQYGRARSPMCMKCHTLVPKDLVPEEYIQYRPTKGGKGIAIKREEGKEVKREEKEKPPSFITPRTSHEILEGILKEFGCEDGFIKAMVRRSKRIGGIHPGDLRNYLSLMESGIKSQNQATYIADEYGFALSEERDKAREIGYKRAYPTERRRGYERYEDPARVRKKDYYTEYPRERYDQERYARSYREPYRARVERDEGISRRDVREMAKEIGDIIDKLIKLMSMARKR